MTEPTFPRRSRFFDLPELAQWAVVVLVILVVVAYIFYGPDEQTYREPTTVTTMQP